MNNNGLKRIMNLTLPPSKDTPANATAKGKTHLLFHLRKEALHARNHELDKLHRIHDLMFQLQRREMLSTDNDKTGAVAGVRRINPHQRRQGHATSYRYLPSVSPNSLATLDLETILAVLLDRIHFFVPYRAACLRLGEGTKEKPLVTVVSRICDPESGSRPNVDYELLADSALKCNSEDQIEEVQPHKYRPGAAFLTKGAIHYYLTIPGPPNGRMMGVFSIFLKADTLLGRWKIKLLNALAIQTSRVIHTSLTYESIRRHIAHRDKGRYNETLQQLLNYSGRAEAPLNRRQSPEVREEYLEEHWCG